MTAPQDLTDERAALPPLPQSALSVNPAPNASAVAAPTYMVAAYTAEQMREYARAALAGAAAAIPEGWKTIDTAPRDGTPLRLFAEGFINDDFNPGGSVEGQWCDDLGWIGAVWNPTHDCWDTNEIVPTHWMPLPAAPSEHQEPTKL